MGDYGLNCCCSAARQQNSGQIAALPELAMSAAERGNFLRNLARVRADCAARGLPVYFHPHCGSRLETPAEIDWLLANCDVQLVFDTGHLLYATAGQAVGCHGKTC